MELKFSPRKIAKIEIETGRPITDVVGEYSMKNLVLLIRHSLEVDEDGAFTAIEEYFTAGGDMTELYLQILESLQVSGFLPKALDISELRSKMEQKLAV